MITVNAVSLQYGEKPLFEDVSLKFTPGNCYGLIGANGAGKSTLLKILSGELEPTQGNVFVPKNMRLSVLKQDHFAYNDVTALLTVMMGHKRLYEISVEKEALYAKPDFSDEDGMRSAELEGEFADLNGWEAEAQIGEMLCGLGLATEFHETLMVDLDDNDKIRVLLAQALFGDPDILLLDEPTNHLAVDSILWLEQFLHRFQHTVVVVSHDRHFLNQVCTHVADIDFRKVCLYRGNYDFWRQASELALDQQRNQNKKSEDKAKQLKEFIRRFSANASKSKQATARKKMLKDLKFERIKPSTRKYPYIVFTPEKVQSKSIVSLQDVSLTVGERQVLKNVSLEVTRGDRIVLVSNDSLATSATLQMLAGELQPDSGNVNWSPAVSFGYFPKDHGHFFEVELNIVDWLRQYSNDDTEEFLRQSLGRMLFSGDDAKKMASVLSGGEKVRCMIAKLMLQQPPCMILDGPTNHLDLESITSLNKALANFPGTLIFVSHDVEFISSLATRVIEITPDGALDEQLGTYDEYLEKRLENIG